MYDFEKRHFDHLIAASSEQAIEEIRQRCLAEEDSRSVYPRLAGHMMGIVQGLHKMAKDLLARVEEAETKVKAFSWAAETTLIDKLPEQCGEFSEQWEKYYLAVDIVEAALKAGISDEALRERLEDGILEAEYKQKRFLDKDEVCVDCGEYVEKGSACAECSTYVS